MSEERLPDLYLEALELDELRRDELVAALRRSEPELAEELARLLASPPTAPSPIDRGPAELEDSFEPIESGPPHRVGSYRIVRELGRGGMGRVFLAEQETPDFRRRVALKLIGRPGFDDEAIRRFRVELRILASLDHPGIVRFLDGGRSPEGHWYLAQEVVEGDDLITHVERRGLGLVERLALFRRVLDAIDWAHGRGVVHRDLKPANILVDAEGRPRLLDFGISKLVGPPDGAAAHAPETETTHRALTPGYASPEQLEGRPVSAASDLYSLGVVLYELVVGQRPFETAGSLLAQQRAVLEQDPEPPSAALRRLGPTRAADHPLRALPAELGRNLDAICLVALRREPEARYPTARAFAEDLQRALDGHPVAPGRDLRRSPVRGFARRHRARLAGAAVLAALVAAGALLALGSLRPRDVPRASVEPEVFPFSHLRTLPLEELERRFVAAPADVDAGGALALALAAAGRLAEAQLVVGRLRQIPGRGDDPLIDYTEASIAIGRDELQRALVLHTRARDTAIARGRGELVGQIRASLGANLLMLGEPDRAAEQMREAADDFRRAGDDASLGRVLGDLAVVHLQRGEIPPAEALLEESLLAADRAGSRPVAALCNLAQLAVLRGRPDQAAPRLERAIALYRQVGDTRRAAERERELSEVLRDLGEPEEADRRLATALEALSVSESPGLARGLHARASADLAAGRVQVVLPAATRIEAIAEVATDLPSLALARHLQGRHAAATGDLAAARRHFGEAGRLLRDAGAADLAGELDLAWAEVEADADPDAVPAILRAAEAGLRDADELAFGFFADLLRARLDVAAGDLSSARRRLDLHDPATATSPSSRRRTAYLRARAAVAVAEGDPAAARSDLLDAIAAAQRSGRTLDALRLRLELAALAVDPAAGRRETAEICAEARRLGLGLLAERAAAFDRQPTPAGRSRAGEAE